MIKVPRKIEKRAIKGIISCLGISLLVTGTALASVNYNSTGKVYEHKTGNGHIKSYGRYIYKDSSGKVCIDIDADDMLTLDNEINDLTVAVNSVDNKLGGLTLSYDSGYKKYGYIAGDGVFHPFRNPAGNAEAANVLAGKTFANANNDLVEGTMKSYVGKTVPVLNVDSVTGNIALTSDTSGFVDKSTVLHVDPSKLEHETKHTLSKAIARTASSMDLGEKHEIRSITIEPAKNTKIIAPSDIVEKEGSKTVELGAYNDIKEINLTDYIEYVKRETAEKLLGTSIESHTVKISTDFNYPSRSMGTAKDCIVNPVNAYKTLMIVGNKISLEHSFHSWSSDSGSPNINLYKLSTFTDNMENAALLKYRDKNRAKNGEEICAFYKSNAQLSVIDISDWDWIGISSTIQGTLSGSGGVTYSVNYALITDPYDEVMDNLDNYYQAATTGNWSLVK